MRIMGKILLLGFCVVLVACLNANVIDANSILQIPKVTSAPVIDASIDGVWSNVSNTYMTSYDNAGKDPEGGYADLFGWSRAMYDDNNFYLLFYTQDDVLWDADATSWTNDGWEFYFDADNSKGTVYDGVNDQQWRIEHKDVASADIDAGSWVTKANVEFAQKDTLNGYMLEVLIPLAELKLDPVAGTEFGFEVQQNDNDGTGRDAISKWWLDTGDDSYLNPSHFGTAVLSDYTVSEVLAVHKTTAAPAIDGVMEDLWVNSSDLITMNSYANGSTVPSDYNDLEGEFRTMWDDDNFYLFFMTKDDVLWDADATSWTNDGWEFYFDADNSKGTVYDGVNDQQMRVEHKDAASADMDAGSWVTKANIEFMQVDVEGGYNLEVKIPLAELKLDPVVDTEFGFETQQNDNDGTGRESISKWWLDAGDDSYLNPSHFGTAALKPGLTGIKEKGMAARNFALGQNYPNPFNPTTTITYSLQSNSNVRLSVFDLMGKEVAVLVNGVQTAGSHDVQFNASNLSSGIYFYKLQTAGQVVTKKMTLVK